MEKELIKEKIFKCIEKQANGETLTYDTNLQDDLGFDSLDNFELIMSLEKEFNINIDEEKSEKINTIQDIIDTVVYLKSKNERLKLRKVAPISEKEQKEMEFEINEKKAWYTFPLTFWELIDKLNWKENCTKENCIKELQEKFYQLCEGNTYVMDYFNNFRNSLRHVLQVTLEEYELKTYGDRCASEFFKYGDDSWDDMANHIIGMGKETYFAILNDPKLASEYTENFVESFAYCFHYDTK